VRWGVEQRLEFIEFRLYWEGGINRADIMEQFGVSVPQASKDLSLYEEKAPGNLVYDKSEKRYLAAERFRAVFLKPDADRYLTQLRTIADRTVTSQETWLSTSPIVDSTPIPHRRVDVEVLRSILEASRKNRALKIRYQSMNAARPEPMWRWISPHAFGNDGLRWHVRAYCHIEQKFKDFILSRCLDAKEDAEPGASADKDSYWHEIFNVVLAPNPKLSDEQQRVIAQDYSMTNRHITVPVRKALLYYFRKRLRLDVASTLDNLRETPVIVANHEAFETALAEAGS
jgi:hypothetical protein